MVLKSAGNFTRNECHDLNAEKIQRVNVLCRRDATFKLDLAVTRHCAENVHREFVATMSCAKKTCAGLLHKSLFTFPAAIGKQPVLVPAQAS